MKRRGQLVLYAVSSAAQLGISIGCALWPLRHYLHHLNTWRRWHQAWTVSDSDLDVCLEGLAFWLAASVCCLLAVLLRHRSSQGTPSRRLKAVKWLLLAAALLGQASWSCDLSSGWQGLEAEDKNLRGQQHVLVKCACPVHWTPGHSVTAALCNQHRLPVLVLLALVALFAACWTQMEGSASCRQS